DMIAEAIVRAAASSAKRRPDCMALSIAREASAAGRRGHALHEGGDLVVDEPRLIVEHERPRTGDRHDRDPVVREGSPGLLKVRLEPAVRGIGEHVLTEARDEREQRNLQMRELA